eukprot:scaffold469572_cov35-Prasinocladus_malaysianus.AAC.1
MEHAATSTPEAIVGSPREVIDGTYYLSDTPWDASADIRKPKAAGGHSRGAHGSFGPNKAAMPRGPGSVRKPPAKSKMSVQQRLKKKLRIK